MINVQQYYGSQALNLTIKINGITGGSFKIKFADIIAKQNEADAEGLQVRFAVDRKSTRLNSSHRT